MHPIIQEVLLAEVNLRFINEVYDFYLTGVLLLPPNYNNQHLVRAAHFIITQSTTPQVKIERVEPIAVIQCSQSYYDATFKIYHWHFLPSYNGFVSILSPEKVPHYYVTTFYVKDLPEHKLPTKPYIINSNFKLTEIF
jgi:hypothetical protein